MVFMKRRIYLIVLCLYASGIGFDVASASLYGAEADTAGVFAHGELTVLPAEEAKTYLQKSLLDACRRCFDARRKRVASLETKEAVLAYKKSVQERWRKALCEFPGRTPLNPRTTGIVERGTYTIEKVIYESRKDHHVTALLYLPKTGTPPYPGVLVPCGHSRNGKAYAGYQIMCIDLAMKGFVVLCYDPIGQGERIQTITAEGKPVMWGTTEHTMVDIGARLTGGGVAVYRIWDGIRSIDYLISRKEVDADRIGCTGNSGGGTMTSYLMATDQRIAVAAPSCYLTSLERLFKTIGAQDGEQNITAQTALGIEHADYIIMRAPKPTIMLTGTYDFFDIDGAWDTYRQAKRLYSILGYGENVDLFEYPDKHGFHKERREASLRWLQRFLKGIDQPFFEPARNAEPDAVIQVTKSGQVLHDLKGVSLWDLNLQKAESLAAQRKRFWKENNANACLLKVKELTGLRGDLGKVTAERKGVLKGKGYTVEKLIIRRPEEVPVPALLFVPENRGGKAEAVVVVDSRGKAKEAGPGGMITSLVADGKIVLSCDVHGFGETAPAGAARYRGNEYKFSYLAIHLGRPLLTQRVEDVLGCLEVLTKDPRIAPEKISLTGIEKGGAVALHAAYFDKRFSALKLVRCITSWMDVVRIPDCRGQLQQIVPLALRFYDLSDLLAAIAPRRVVIENAVDPAGRVK